MSDKTIIDYDDFVDAWNDPEVQRVLARGRAYTASLVERGHYPCHGRCQLEGSGKCPEGCVTPEQW